MPISLDMLLLCIPSRQDNNNMQFIENIYSTGIVLTTGVIENIYSTCIVTLYSFKYRKLLQYRYSFKYRGYTEHL